MRFLCAFSWLAHQDYFARRSFVILCSQLHRLPQIILVNDVVPSEYRLCFMPADFHCDILRDTRADHVADGCAAEVVKNAPWNASLFTGRCPRLTKVCDCPFFAAQGLSFEKSFSVDVQKDVDATAWAINDIRNTPAHRLLPVAILALPPGSDSQPFVRAKKVFRSLKAEMISGTEVGNWVKKRYRPRCRPRQVEARD